MVLDWTKRIVEEKRRIDRRGRRGRRGKKDFISRGETY